MALHKIIESSSIKEASFFLNGSTLLILDIDNTLIHTKQMLGSVQWCSFLIEQFLQQGLSLDAAVDRAIPRWEKIQKIQLSPL